MLIPGLLFFALLAGGWGDDESLLQVRASIVPPRLARGQEGHIRLKFSAKAGITISPMPVFTIELGPSQELVFPKDFFTSSDLEMEILEEEGKEYLNLKEPVSIPFTVSLNAKRGSHRIEGWVKYFAFSFEEGWCLKEKAEFSASFYTSNRIYDKK
ncbi:MAG: hypothetical protein GQ544_05135 [Candidatus Aminicenantes bacterium]|nr:hypothetical protein [Candidatus Aminicenantes bacterium]